MSIMKCTESDENAPEIDVALWTGCATRGPQIDVSIPHDCLPPDYEGPGIFMVDLRELFDELVDWHIAYDGGERTPDFVALLREYADRLEADIPDE